MTSDTEFKAAVPTLSRRGLLAGAGCVAVMAVIGGAGRAFAGDGSLLRLPGAQDEQRFLATCLKCDKCRSVCPQNCVSLATVEEGLVVARTPKLDFHKGYCDFCDRCIEVCPTGALRPFSPDQEKLGVAVIDQEECIAWKQGGCVKCVEACPYQVVALNQNGRPVVDAQRCNGCGACEFACPSATFMSYSGSRRRGINVQKEA
ncbi:4Fe-4S dicluster domain-containing protein [Parvibacter caecicola]|uniref:4Fe-4S dicluster domain-containing protein n=1 Tax=Parvibacter caecicola TaxID=747645 RepID=UPI0023F55C1D|nr:4Fe-4S dicluster domain-containing protein [Parvibacter caecicola]